MAVGIGESICAFCPGQVTALLEQRAEVEGAVRLAALVRALVARLRRLQIATGLEEHSEVERRAGMAHRIGFAIGALGCGEVTLSLEQNPQTEPVRGSPGAANQHLCAPRHPSKAFVCLGDESTQHCVDSQSLALIVTGM
jgi:hypothetical protein